MSRRQQPPKERLAEASLRLFFSQGYNGTGVKEIVDAAGVPKGSFYAYWPSKEAMGAAVVERYWAGADERLAPLDEGGPPEARVRRHFQALSDLVVDQRFVNGCLLGNFSTEVAGSSEAIRSTLLHVFEGWASRLNAVLSEAAAAGALRAGVEPAQAAEFLINAWEGAVLKAKVERTRRPLDLFEDLAFAAVFAR